MRRLARLALAAGVAACGSRTDLQLGADDAAAADVAVVACGPATCGGCCDDAGACQPGTAQSVCGVGGMACLACDPRYDVCNPQGGGGQVVGNVCWAPCPVRECDGCCTANLGCVLGTADDSCGGPQRVCEDCTALGMVCGAVDGTLRGCKATR
jgi:hypothetical protein